MATLTIELPPQKTQTTFNLRRWAEVLKDPEWAKYDWRIETDRYGYVIMSPPPAPGHGTYQSKIAQLLWTLMPEGHILTECPISTADGVKAADVAWASPGQIRELGDEVCFPRASEICVEVLSPSNTEAEIDEKKALYFDADAKEVWLCSVSGAMSFFMRGAARAGRASQLCPGFPKKVELR